MPKLFNTILGKVQGTLNDLTFFYKNNVQFVKSRKKPHSKSRTKSVSAKNNRRQFANSHYFSKIITKEKEIYDLWNFANVKGISPYFKVHSYNRTKCTHEYLTEQNAITPDGIPITVEDTMLVKNKLSFKFKLYRKFDDYLSTPYSLYVCTFISDGVIKSDLGGVDEELKIIEVTDENPEFTEVELNVTNRIIELDIPEFNYLHFFIAAVKKTNDEYEWSSTFTKMFDISGFQNKWYLDKVIK